MEGFGQTETALILANFQGTVSKPGSMGKPSPMYQVRLLKEDGSFAGVDEPGEVVVIPPDSGMECGIFTGYCQDEALYENVWREGVYHTGDTATMDQDGYYWYIGRVDDLIKTKGFRVGPFEVENVLMEHPAVLECAVIGVPDEDRGQAIKGGGFFGGRVRTLTRALQGNPGLLQPPHGLLQVDSNFRVQQ